MPTRSRTSFQKRQKELARMEKQRDKAARKLQRKRDAASGEGGEASDGVDILDTDAEVDAAAESESEAPASFDNTLDTTGSGTH